MSFSPLVIQIPVFEWVIIFHFMYVIFNKASMSRFNHLIKLISKSSKDSFLYHLLIAHVSKFQKFLPNYINLRRWTPLTHMHHVCVSEKRLAPRNVRSSYLLQLLGTLWKIVEGRDIHKERNFKIISIRSDINRHIKIT